MNGELLLADEKVSQALIDLLHVKQCFYGFLGEEAAFEIISEMDMIPTVEAKLDWGLDMLEFIVHGRGGIQTSIEQSKTPVDPETFLMDSYFLGKSGEVYPEVFKAYIELSTGGYDEAVMTGGIGSGKCLGLDTPVIMFDGTTKKVQDIATGDKVMGWDSNPRLVKSTTTGREPMYLVKQRGGEDYVVNESHILSLKYTNTWNKHKNCYKYKDTDTVTPKNLTVREYLALSPSHKSHLKGWKPDVVEFPSVEVTDPYFLGLWLGDGSQSNTEVMTMDKEVVEYLEQLALKHGMTVSTHEDLRGNQAMGYCLVTPKGQSNPLRDWLRRLDVWKNKHIPHSYLTASVEDRLQLIAGLLDSDGSLSNGCFDFVQKREELVDQVAFVCRSVGLRVKKSVKTVGSTEYYRLSISGETSIIPTKIARKKAQPRQQLKNPNRWGIEVEALGEGDYYGFELEGEDRLFLLGDFTVTHNTQLALYSLSYQLYLLSCLVNPQGTFGLDSSSEVKMIFQSLRKSTASDVDYARFKHMIEASPYFRNEYPHNANLESKLVFPNRVILEPLSGAETAAIGQNIIGGLIDEINFMAVIENSKQASDGGVYNQAIELYNSIARRRKTRFMAVGGKMAGLLCVVSSKKVPEEFTDVKMKEALTNPRIFVYDKRVWDVKPQSFCGETFKLFVGDNTRRPYLIEPEDRIAAEDYHLVDEIPIEFRTEFEDDLVKSVRDIAGHTTLVTTPFFTNTEKVLKAFGKTQNISKYDFVDFGEYPCELIPENVINKQFPRYAHVDLALTQDSAGITIGHVPAFKNVKQIMDDGTQVWTMMPHIVADLMLEVKPPKKGEIPLDKVRSLLITLRDVLGLPIKWVSYDSFQSRDSMQILRRHGFECGLLSVDTSMEPYNTLKTAINEERCDLPAHAKAQKEAVALEVDYAKQKVDHNALNTKDVMDSLAGMAHGISIQKAVWLQHGVSWQKPVQSK